MFSKSYQQRRDCPKTEGHQNRKVNDKGHTEEDQIPGQASIFLKKFFGGEQQYWKKKMNARENINFDLTEIHAWRVPS